MGQLVTKSRVVIYGMIIGLLALLALPVVSLAAAGAPASDEEPRRLNANDEAVIAPLSGPRNPANANPVFDAYTAPGTMLARGTNTQPSGVLQLLTYEVEEVAVPAGASIPTLTGRSVGPTVVRLSVIGGPFTMRSIPPTIWVDDVPLQFIAYSADLTRLSVLAPDRTVLRNGAVIALSYGDAATRERLPEPLTLGAGSP